MAITITAYDANKDGKGIDFAAYLKAYDRTYTPASRGDFSSPPVNGVFNAAQYATYDAANYGAVMIAGSQKWNYSFASGSDHKVRGSISEIVFGNNIVLDGTADRFKVTPDLKISGLNVTNQVTVDTIVGDLAGGKNTSGGATTGLLTLLKANSISFIGGNGADVFTGFGKADKISGGNGNDILRGDAGTDTLYGDAGNDTLYGGNDNDTLYGDAGNDKLYGDAGNDKLYGGAGDDTLYGGAGIDTLSGGAGIDTLYGGNDNDFLFGYAGNDKIYGDAGNDRLEGGVGNDTLDGGLGNDILSGGAGADTFIIKKGQGIDRITDFEAGKAGLDVIRLDKTVFKNLASVLSAATETRAGDLVIKYGTGSITLEGIAKADLHTSDFLFV